MRIWNLMYEMRSRVVRDQARRAIMSYKSQQDCECPCCGFLGKLDSFGTPQRMNASCPQCGSKERHRLFALALRDSFIDFAGKNVIHFAPEPNVKQLVLDRGASKVIGADITPGRADIILNMEQMELEDSSIERIICSHVMEHVNDKKALAEIRRVLVPGGYAVIMIPIVEGWEKTYEDSEIVNEEDRDRFFGQYDHVRFYGADFRERVRRSGLSLSEYTADGPTSPLYGLLRGEKVFKATKHS